MSPMDGQVLVMMASGVGLLALIVGAVLVGNWLARLFVHATRRPPDEP